MPAAVLDLIEYGGFVDKASGSIDMRSTAGPLGVIIGTGTDRLGNSGLIYPRVA
jgi:hypothetical protein